jgi:protease IV
MNIDSTSIGKHAEINSPVRPYNQDELKKLQEQLQSFYDDFVEKVADSRHSTPEQIDALAQGRVWTGRQAKQNRLVDELGGLDRAIALAKQRAKIAADSSVEIVVYPPKRTFFELLSDQLSGASESKAISEWLNASLSRSELDVLRTMRGPLSLFRRGEVLALMPFTFLR